MSSGKIETKCNQDQITETVELDSDRFKKLCDIAGLTHSQMMTCRYISVTCKDFGFIEVEARYNAIGELRYE